MFITYEEQFGSNKLTTLELRDIIETELIHLMFLPDYLTGKNVKIQLFSRCISENETELNYYKDNGMMAKFSDLAIDEINTNFIKLVKNESDEAKQFHANNRYGTYNPFKIRDYIILCRLPQTFPNDLEQLFNDKFDEGKIAGFLTKSLFAKHIITHDYILYKRILPLFPILQQWFDYVKDRSINDLSYSPSNKNIAKKPNTPKKRKSKNNEEYNVNDIKIASHYYNTNIDDTFIQSINTALNQTFTLKPIKYPNGKIDILKASYLNGIDFNKKQLETLIKQLKGGKKLLNDEKVMKIFKESERNKALSKICNLIGTHEERLKNM